MNNNHTKMLALYNDLDALLRVRYRENDMSKSVMMRFIKDLANSGLKEYIEASKKLNMIRIIRNDMIHDLDMNRYQLIEISDETIAFLEDVIIQVKNPRRAIDGCTRYEKLLKIGPEDLNNKLLDLVHEMRQLGHTQVPVLNEHRSVVGVISPNVVFDYINHHSSIDMESVTIGDLKDFYKLDNHYSETYKFVKMDANFEDVSTIYIDALENNQKLVCLFVTRNGQIDEPLLGIVVLSDLYRD